MNRLSVETTDDNGLSFTLMIDEKTLPDLVGASDPSIPYWLVDDDLPYLPPHGSQQGRDKNTRIVCVCECGEYGCGHTRCEVIKEDNQVVFKDFSLEVSEEGKKMEFVFSRSNYDEVVSRIISEAKNMENIKNA